MCYDRDRNFGRGSQWERSRSYGQDRGWDYDRGYESRGRGPEREPGRAGWNRGNFGNEYERDREMSDRDRDSNWRDDRWDNERDRWRR